MMYFYKESDKWVLGHSIYSYAPAGNFYLLQNSDDYVSIIPIAKNKDLEFLGLKVVDIAKNSNGDKYSSLSEFISSTSSFFVDATQPLAVRVAELEEKQTFFLDYYGTDNPVVPQEEQFWFHTTEKKLYTYFNSQWLEVTMSADSIYVNRSTNQQYAWSGTDLITMTAPMTKSGVEALIYSPKLAIPALDIDLSVADVFEKTLTGESSFTISNPILFKPFRVILTGGSLNATLFTGYTTTWLASTAQSDYVTDSVNYLYCEIREAGKIYCFWGE